MPSCHLWVYHACLTLCMLRSDKYFQKVAFKLLLSTLDVCKVLDIYFSNFYSVVVILCLTTRLNVFKNEVVSAFQKL